MNKEEARARIQKLKEAINTYRYEYHVLDTSSISESALDSLKHELFTLEQAYPDFITSDSPTQRIGGAPLSAFSKWTHQFPMLSMEDVFSDDEWHEWKVRIEKYGKTTIDDFVVMSKIDGLAVSLTYRDGLLVNASTRGDGKIGEDVTQNIKTIEAIPLSIGTQYSKNEIIVRGEVYIQKKDFDLINKEQEKKGEEKYANPRNLAAGSIRQLDPSIAGSRRLRFFAWTVLGGHHVLQSDALSALQDMGFSVPPFERVKTSEVQKIYQKLQKKREQLSYWVDGVVVRVNDISLFERLGVTGKTPRGLVAWKFPAEEKTTIVRAVEWSVGRTGKVTPVATVDSVFIAGTTVSHATLHNPDEIKRLDVRIGDTVVLIKAGDIIPKIMRVLPELRHGTELPIELPHMCPVCEQKISSSDNLVDIFCRNPNCFSIESERIVHAVKVFEIDGMGPRAVEKFIQAGLLQSPADLFALQKDEIAQIEGYAEKSAQKLVDEIQKRKHISFAKFLRILSIPHIGEETAELIASHISTIEGLMHTSKEQLEIIEGIGPIMAETLVQELHAERVQSLIHALHEAGVVITKAKKQINNRIAGKTFVLTGTLESLSRDEAKERIRNAGGFIASSVSKKTDFVVVGDAPGSKLKEAETLGIIVLSEDSFLSLFN